MKFIFAIQEHTNWAEMPEYIQSIDLEIKWYLSSSEEIHLHTNDLDKLFDSTRPSILLGKKVDRRRRWLVHVF